MDNNVNKKIKASMKKVYDKNHPNVFETLNKNYTSLNKILDEYKMFFEKLDKLKDPKTWCEPIIELENYDKLNSLYNKIEVDLKKAFNVVPGTYYSLKIDHKNDILTINYFDHHSRSYEIKDFIKKVKNGFYLSQFNIVGEPLDFSKVLEKMMRDINPNWIKLVVKYFNECIEIDKKNEDAKISNQQAYLINKKREEKYREIFKTIDKLKVVFPIKFVNGEKIIFNDNMNDYYVVSNQDKVMFKVKSSNNFDESINSILFDKCKIDESSIPMWITNKDLFNKLEWFTNDFKLIENQLNKLINNNKKYYVELNEIKLEEPQQIIENVPSFIDNSEKEIIKKREEINVTKTKEKIDLEVIKNKVYQTLLKVDGNVNKKIELPSQVLFKETEDGVKIIDDRFVNYLKCFDLSKIKFDNVLVRGIDFSDCNPKLLNPQTVLNKDLSGTRFNTNVFNKNTSFFDVNLDDAIIIINDDIDINFNGAKGNLNTFVNVNNKMITIHNYKI